MNLSRVEWFEELQKAYKDRDPDSFSGLLESSYSGGYNADTVVICSDGSVRSVLQWILSRSAGLQKDVSDNELDQELKFIEAVLDHRKNPNVPVTLEGVNGLITVEETPFRNVRAKCAWIELLLRRGADINSSGSPSLNPPLFCAGESAVVETLLKHGADPNVPAFSFFEYVNPNYGVSVIENYIKMHVPVPFTPSGYSQADYGQLYEDAAKSIGLLIEYGAPVNADEKGTNKSKRRSPLMELCKLKLYLLMAPSTLGKDEEKHFKRKYQPRLDEFLCRAFDMLVDAGADVNYEDPLGDTPSTVCASPKLLKKLVEKGCDITHRNIAGMSLLDNIINRRGEFTVYSQLCQDGDELLDCYLAKGGSFGCLAYGNCYLAQGGSLDCLAHGTAAIFTAVRNVDTGAIRKLAEAGADLNMREKDFGRTPLYYAFYAFGSRDNNDLIRLMTEYGADLTVTDYRGRNLLHAWASNFCGVGSKYRDAYMNVMKLLVTNGVDINALDRFGETPMRILLDNSLRKDIPVLLPYLGEMIKCGADPYKGDDKSAMDRIPYKKYRQQLEKHIGQRDMTRDAIDSGIELYER